MKIYVVLLTTIAVLNLVACSTPADKKDEALAEFTEEKTQTLKEYKECVKSAGAVEEKLAQCEALLKAIGALEGGTVNSTTAAPAATVE